MPDTRSQLKPLPPALRCALIRWGVLSTRLLLQVDIRQQQVELWEKVKAPLFALRRRYRASTSAFGIGQKLNSNCTPLGLHRVAAKIGGGLPTGTVFKHRQPIGFTWQGLTGPSIAHRILWLEGLEPGFNRGGEVDTFRRYIYIHGFGDETTLGRPQSHGCVHLAATDLIPLYDRVPIGTLVWIASGLR